MMLLARYALIIPSIIVMAFYVPMLFEVAFGERVQKTHIFYSPVIQKFIWVDKLIYPEEEGLEDAHHAQFVQMDQDGKRYTRQEFEKLLPFIYYRNMEIWGLLPIQLQGRTFDKKTIRANRQVLEFKPRQISDRALKDEVYPLIESVPGSARLVFPEDRFRLGKEMEFINADYNRRDEKVTRVFNDALKKAGFQFPGRLSAGKPTILKPFDEGVFLVDASGAVFHVKRVNGEPRIVKTPIDPALGVRSIKVNENRRREFYGMVLTADKRLHLISYDNYRLITLPLESYDPDTMDFKLIINPLYRTAIYSDSETIRAVVMDSQYRPMDKYEHTMPGASLTVAQSIFNSLTPFRINLEDPSQGYLAVQIDWHGWRSWISIVIGLAGFLFLAYRRRARGLALVLDGILVAITGLYGLIAVFILPPQND